MVFGENKKSYPKRDPENLSVFLIYDIVASKISLFLFVSKRKSPHKSISLLILSEKDSKLLEIDQKIKTLMRKMMAVQEVMYCIFDLQTTRIWGIQTVLKTMSKLMLIKMITT